MSDIKQKICQLFTQHPHSINETYFQHLCFAGCSGLKLTVAGIACMIHSIFPFVFVKTASNVMKNLSEEIQKRKANQ